MSKFISIAISLLVLIQSVNLHFNDLMELDDLIEHYQFHNKEYGDNFLVFLSKHYGDLKTEHSQKHQEEKRDHEKLPFQHSGHFTQMADFIMNHNFFPGYISEIPNSQKHNFHYQISYSFDIEDGLFQPPRHS